MNAPETRGDAASEPRRERVLSGPLVVFLLLVGGILAYAAVERWSTPGLDEAVRMLSDGDLDGPERPAAVPLSVSPDIPSSWRNRRSPR